MTEIELIDEFKGRSIPCDSPGFYDDPNFLDAEKLDPTYLEMYAKFVLKRHYEEECIFRARKEIPFICGLFHNELKKEGREGACIDASGVLSRILEQEGYWNYLSKSSLTIEFPQASGIEKRYFWPYDLGNYVVAHAFVVAPPFAVIDLTIRQQPYKEREKDWLPDLVVEETHQSPVVNVSDLISPDMQFIMKEIDGIPDDQLLQEALPRFAAVTKDFHPLQIEIGATKLKYVQYAISAPDVSLEEMGNLILGGRRPFAFYNDIIAPALKRFRESQ